MFTGIIEELGVIRKITLGSDGARLEVAAQTVLEDAKLGDSIAVNGVCLTVIELGTHWFAADVSAETLRRTSLQAVHAGTSVNLERPLTPSTRLGGHLVQGHVDATGRLLEARAAGEGWVVRIEYPPELWRYMVEKGSIAVDGISLTIAAITDEWFEIAVIPHTWKVTNLSSLPRGTAVNLEVDLIAKYVERMMNGHLMQQRSVLTMEKLQTLGY